MKFLMSLLQFQYKNQGVGTHEKNIINLLFVFSFLFTGCSETKKEDTLKNTNQSNKSDQTLDNRTISDVLKKIMLLFLHHMEI